MDKTSDNAVVTGGNAPIHDMPVCRDGELQIFQHLLKAVNLVENCDHLVYYFRLNYQHKITSVGILVSVAQMDNVQIRGNI